MPRSNAAGRPARTSTAPVPSPRPFARSTGRWSSCARGVVQREEVAATALDYCFFVRNLAMSFSSAFLDFAPVMVFATLPFWKTTIVGMD